MASNQHPGRTQMQSAVMKNCTKGWLWTPGRLSLAQMFRHGVLGPSNIVSL